MTFIYVMPIQEDENGFVNGNVYENGVPPNNQEENIPDDPDGEEGAKKQSVCSRIFDPCCNKMCSCCCYKKYKEEAEVESESKVQKQASEKMPEPDEEDTKSKTKRSCFSCCKRKPKDGNEPIVEVEPEEKPPGCWQRMKCRNCCKGCSSSTCCSCCKGCKKKNKIADTEEKTPGCFEKLKRKKKNDDNWAQRRESVMNARTEKQGCCSCWKRLFCSCSSCCKKKKETRKTSVLSQKKSLSSSMAPPVEDNRPKLDMSLVEHTSHMRGAIPVLPIPIAWMCLFLNVFLPGAGTIMSGLICLCIGKPRFSPRDGAKARIGAFVIDVIVGFSQLFCVLFCLVGWGWSIWWGVIMIKVARKYKKLKKAERQAAENAVNAAAADEDVEKGT